MEEEEQAQSGEGEEEEEEEPEEEQARRGRKNPRRRGVRARDLDPVVRLTKGLSFALRRGAEKFGLTLGEDGFVDVSEILRLPEFKSWWLQDVKYVVEVNKKQRFTVRPSPSHGRLQIRFNQPKRVTEMELVPLLSPSDFPEVVAHGGYMRHWPIHRKDGLSRMKRTHIHLAPGLPEDSNFPVGIKKNCEVAIVIDVAKALEDGILFFRAVNGLIITPGDDQGMLLPCYFREAHQLRPQRTLLPLE